jgi:DNA-binding NarL/FixJ family response regulator
VPKIPIRVALLEDVPLFRQVIEQVVSENEQMEMVASAGTGHKAVTVFPAAKPDVALLDLFLPDGFGFDFGLQLRVQLPDLHIIILSEHVKPKVLQALPEAERPYWSYLLKTGVSSRQVLTDAIKGCLNRSLMDEQVREKKVNLEGFHLEMLSSQQREILSLVAAGMSNAAIAQKLFIAPKSVEYHLTQIYSQLKVAPDATTNARVRAAMIFAQQERED